MLVQIIHENGVTHLLRRLLANGSWLIGRFEKFNNNWKFIKKVNLKSWNKAVAEGEGQVENIPNPESLPPNLFPD